MYGCGEKTLAQLLDEYVTEKDLQMILASMWDFHGLPPSKVSGLYYAVATGECLRNGTYYIKGRSQELSNTLARIITNRGGRILFETQAEEILLKDDRVTGVRVAGGEVIPARAVVSNANPLTTIRDMLPVGSVPSDYLKDLESFRPSLSTFIVWLGLDREVGDRIPACGLQVISEGGPEAAYHFSRTGDVDKAPFRVSIFDNMYEGYSRAGTSTLKIFCLSGYGPWRPFETDYRNGEKGAYRTEKARWANVLIRRTEEQVLPGLSSMIQVMDAATPLTNWRFTGNEEGAVYGFEQSLHHAYIERVDNRTPVKGLYMAGGWCMPGGGFWGVLMSGRMAFTKMMEDWAG
jgi:prolycopene isomerase